MSAGWRPGEDQRIVVRVDFHAGFGGIAADRDSSRHLDPGDLMIAIEVIDVLLLSGDPCRDVVASA